jgi:hypothetical protein
VLFLGHQAQSNFFAILHPLEVLGKPFNTEERSKRRNGGKKEGFLRAPLFFPLYLSDLDVPELKKYLSETDPCSTRYAEESDKHKNKFSSATSVPPC